MKLAVEISDAADLAPKDGAASCNPYVEVDFDDQRQRTATKPADRNPYWNQTLVFDVRDPARFPSLAIDVSVLHDRRLLQDAASSLRPHTFLGRVRINAASVAQSPQEALLQRYPLEKRGLFSRVSGDIALRIYLLTQNGDGDPNNSNNSNNAAAAAASMDGQQQQQEPVAFAPPDGNGKSGGRSSHDHQDEPRIFRSVPAAAESAAPAATTA